MAITCPRCGAEVDATLFEFEHPVRCGCGAEICYPGADRRSGHVAAEQSPGGKQMAHRPKDHTSTIGGSSGEGGVEDAG